LNSSQTASPYIYMYKRPPILSLKPKYTAQGSQIAKWRLRITDSFGNVFRDFSGDGTLPPEIIWDGRSKDNSMLDVGISYSYIFTVIDKASNPTSQMGRPILLESLMYDEKGETIGCTTADIMFKKEGVQTNLSQKGELYCCEVADLLTARGKYPLVIQVFAKDVDKARWYGEIIQKYLTERYVLPKENIKIDGMKARSERVVFRIRS
jgi:hypothetical protein